MTIYRGSIIPGIGSTATGKAEDVTIEDVGSLLVATNVEDALQEMQTSIDTDEAALANHIADTTTHGTTGDIVGTSDTQTLTNKTLTTPIISQISNTGTLTLPTSTDTLVGRDTTDTLTNKTLTSPDVNGGTADSLTSLSVAAGSSGNVSRWVMSTGTATATYYAKLATLAFPATNNVAANMDIVLTPKGAAGGYAPIMFTVTALQGTAGLSTSSKIQMHSTTGQAVAYNDIFLTAAAATNGTNVELWMQSVIAAAYDVHVVSASFDTGVSISAWNDGATWTATDPVTAPGTAVSVTSDWAGSGWVNLTPQNGWTDMVIQYRKEATGGVRIRLYTLTVVGTTTNGTIIGVMPVGARHSFTKEIPLDASGAGGTNGAIGQILVEASGNIKLYYMAASPTQIRASGGYLAEQ